MSKKPKSFHARARSWITKNKLRGPQAFPRFVMLVFVERVNQTSDEFIFKGGNLLWVYIKTPRATVDVDFVTKSLADHGDVRQVLEVVCERQDSNVDFSIKTFEPVQSQGAHGAAVTIAYRTAEGQENTFDLDIVYAIPTAATTIPSPLEDDEAIVAVTMENIVADKIAAAHRYRSGNSRMKDFDDLWRISVVAPDPINWTVLAEILNSLAIPTSLDAAWIGAQMERSWHGHVKRNVGLPADLPLLMESVNEWLRKGLGL